MSLQRHREVARLWDWLPAFRAAAEYESLQRASLALAVSPSALSRTIKLLEEAYGRALFSRSPAGLTLTEEGQRLLVATREAMRRVHEALPSPSTTELRAAGSDSVMLRLMLDAAVSAFPGWTLRLQSVPAELVAEAVLCGDHDVALVARDLAAPGLSVTELTALPIVRALPPGATGERVALLTDDEGEAAVRCESVEQLLEVSTRLGLEAQLPRVLVPPAWTVRRQVRRQPLWLARRADLDAAPAWWPPLLHELGERLAAPVSPAA